MNFSEQFVSVLDALCEKFGVVVDWSQQNIIPYISQLMNKCITYEVVTSIIWCIIFLVLFIISYGYSIRFHKKAMDKQYGGIYDFDEPIAWIALCSWIVLAAVTIIGMIVITCQVFDIAECIILPEKFLLNFISRLKG